MMYLAVDVIGVPRLEARACAIDTRGDAAFHEPSEPQDGMLRRSFLYDGDQPDGFLWSVLEEEPRHAKVIWGGEIVLT